MTKTGWALSVLTVLIIVAAIILFILPAKSQAPTTSNNPLATTTPPTDLVAQIPDTIIVATPKKGEAISSTTITIAGTARGPWYFEASFPVEIQNASGTVIAHAPAKAQGSWQTTDFVPFSVTLSYPAQPAGSQGTIVLKKDNPSGDPANDQSLSLPVTFQ